MDLKLKKIFNVTSKEVIAALTMKDQLGAQSRGDHGGRPIGWCVRSREVSLAKP